MRNYVAYYRGQKIVVMGPTRYAARLAAGKALHALGITAVLAEIEVDFAEWKMNTYIVEYTNEEVTGNQVLIMEVEASDIDEAYEIMDDLYPEFAVDNIYHSALVA
jgi:hypothetical protein